MIGVGIIYFTQIPKINIFVTVCFAIHMSVGYSRPILFLSILGLPYLEFFFLFFAQTIPHPVKSLPYQYIPPPLCPISATIQHSNITTFDQAPHIRLLIFINTANNTIRRYSFLAPLFTFALFTLQV